MGVKIWPRNMLVYAPGGIGKSTAAAKAAAYVNKTEGKKIRIVNADGGGTESAFSPLLSAGVASIWHIDQEDEKSLFTTLEKASLGWWPADPSQPGSPLEPPTNDWKPCPLCGGDTGAAGLASVQSCKACGKQLPPGTILRLRKDKTPTFEEVGMVVFEGVSKFGEMLLQRLKKIDPGGGNSLTDGDGFKISAPGQSHYGMAQSYLSLYINNSRKIPTELVMWTALEMRADEDGKPIYGPKGPGKALTTQMIPWFTDVLHLDVFPLKKNGVVQKDADGVELLERRMFIAPHFDRDNPTQKFAAKTSVPFGGEMPLSLPPDMRLFFDTLKKAYEKAAAEAL